MTAGPEVRFRTITRTRLRSLDPLLAGKSLSSIYEDNIRSLSRGLDFCEAHGIRLFRITSDLFPQSEEQPGLDLVTSLSGRLARIGSRATESGIRLVMHPDQFVVLNSDDPAVVRNGVAILQRHALLLDLLAQPRSPWAALQIHGGKGGRRETLLRTIASLDPAIRTRLTLENDERAWCARDILSVCREAQVPMVFDAHHHLCCEKLEGYDDPSMEELTRAAGDTWPDPQWQLVHISNGREGLHDPRHGDFVEQMPQAFRAVPWIEVEAKQKDLAVLRLKKEWSAC